jgi:tetratricopeptide (TPR) repeat protein
VDSLPRQVLLGGFGLVLMVLSLLVRTRGDDDVTPTTAAAVLPVVPVPGAVPRATAYFTGRAQLLADLRQALEAEGLVVLTGLGGVGKTQLALAHLDLYHTDYDLAWWLRAEQDPTLAEDYAALADARQLTDPAATIAHKTAASRRWLEANRRWLLVFDNATDAASVTRYLPSTSSRGQVIVTSRDRLWPEVATIPVQPLARAESVQFLCDHTPSDPQTAAALADLLGDLPLALEQARAYLAVTRQSAADYLQDLQRELAAPSGELLGEGTGHYQTTVATTWTLSVGQARREAPGAAELLTLLSFLAPEAIPRSLPAEHAGTLPRELRRVAADHRRYERAVGALARYSLLTLTEDTLTVHRLVQAVTRQPLSARAARRWAGAAVRLLAAAFPDDSDDVGSWPVCALLLPHALAAADHASRLQADPRATAWLLNQAGGYLWARAEPRAAADAFVSALTINARLGPDHPEVATSLSNLGLVLGDLEEFQAARDAHQRALTILEARLGPDHPRVAITLNNLGLALRDLGELGAARYCHQRALTIYEARVGPDHPDVALTLNNLGSVLQDLGELQAARDHLERALTIYEARLGPDHPQVALTLNNLGDVLQDLGELQAARDHLERALTIYEARLGPNHPQVATTLNNLGDVLQDLGELQAARDHYQRTLTIAEARLGPDHPNVAIVRDNLARVLAALDEQPGQPTAGQ